MTTRKGFKRLVRARAAKTGERYATARRVLLAETGPSGPPSSDDPRTGRRSTHPDTASMATVLAARGVVSPITGRPLSEALLLVAGGGLGAGYILWEFESRADGPRGDPSGDRWLGRPAGPRTNPLVSLVLASIS